MLPRSWSLAHPALVAALLVLGLCSMTTAGFGLEPQVPEDPAPVPAPTEDPAGEPPPAAPPQPPPQNPEPPAPGTSFDTLAAPALCGGVQALAADEVEQMLRNAAASLDVPTMTAAVVDRAGRVLGILRRNAPAELDDEAVGLARTGAFFSNDQAPLSSRTVRFISGIHFPPGIPNTPNAALYGIENTNRGCDMNVSFEPGREVPPARSAVHAGPCEAGNTFGCGPGPVTGKADLFDSDPRSVDPGGLPVFRGATLVGGVGVTGTGPGRAEFAALTAVAATAGLSPTPDPLPAPGVVFIDGIRLPFVRQVEQPAGTAPGDGTAGTIVDGPRHGGCIPAGYLVGPRGGTHLTRAEVEQIVEQARQTAGRTRAVIRLPPGERARMVIAVGDVDGEILALFRMLDATVFSIDVAVAKARNVVWFSGAGTADLPGVPAGTAITNRTISFGSQPFFPAGIDGSGPGPFFSLYEFDSHNPCSQGSQPATPNQNGVVFFPGSLPLYRGGQLIGGLGISGDGVEQDDYVAFLGGRGFQPPEARWADQVRVQGVRLPFLKFPRNPEQ
ncbi:MAG: heme-binding protein [Thermoanaerobaculia bacterium]